MYLPWRGGADMRVGVYADHLDPSLGGGYTFQDDVLQALLAAPARDHSFVVYSDRVPGRSRNAAPVGWRRAPGPRWVRMQHWLSVAAPNATFVANTLGLRGWFARRLRRDGIEFVWFLTPRYLRTDVPSLYTVWDLQHRVQPWFPEVSAGGRWHYRERLYQQILPRAAAVIVPNAAGQAELAFHYQVPRERVLVLPHPTPAFALRAPSVGETDSVRARYDLPDPFVLYPAQFWPHKNHTTLLFALQELRERHGVVLGAAFVGSDRGNATHIRAQVLALGLGAQVRLLGFVSRDDLTALYQSALALAYPSFFGPENLPPLEAFALGCPVVAARVAGAAEQYGDAAVLVEPTDSAAWAAALKAVASDQALCQRLVASGRERATRWTAADYVAGVLEYLDRFAAVRRCWP